MRARMPHRGRKLRRSRTAEFCRDTPSERMRNVVKHTATSVVTIERFIIEEERNHPEATGELSGILYDLALAAKMIANKVRSAGLADILGATDSENVQGEVQQKLDILANEIIIKAMDHGGRLCAMASEEEPGIIQIPEPLQVREVLPAVRSARRIVEHRRQRSRRHDLLRRAQDHARAARRARGHAAAGAAAGRGRVRDLRVEHDDGVYDGSGCARLHARSVDRRVPAVASEHSHSRTTAGICRSTTRTSSCGASAVRSIMRSYKGLEADHKALSTRYVGSLVADFHRNLLGGGIFAYPANQEIPNGKLRLSVRSESAGVHRRTGGRCGVRRHTARPRRLAHGTASAHAALHREQERSRVGAQRSECEKPELVVA